MNSGNIFKINALPKGDKEIFETLASGKHVKIERITSYGQVTPADKWYEPDKEEWVILLQGKASVELPGGKVFHLGAGDYLHIPAGTKHRVSYTSKEPHCIWLAAHFI